MEDKIIKKLYKLALKAYKKNEVPVSAIIVKKNRIISKAYNKKNISNNAFFHAEIICLQRAYKKLKSWNLSGCTMYVSLEPCNMCKEVIQNSRIDKVIYILSKGKITNEYKNTKYEQMYVKNVFFRELIDNFFKKIRK